MLRASTLFTDDARRRVEAAVAAAEKTTSAEIVPAVATASGRYDRAEDLGGLWLGIALMAAVFLLLPGERNEPGTWGDPPALLKLAYLAAAVLVGFVGGAVVTARVVGLRRLLTPRRQMLEETLHRAREVFFDRRVHHTAAQGGVLIYVSLFERRAAVLADAAVLSKLGQAALDELCAKLTAELARGDVPAALVAAVEETGRRLAAALPAASANPNEISDALVVID